MQNLMNILLICSGTMAALALIFLVLSPLLSRRYGSKWQYYAWLVIVIGFIIPWRPHFNFEFLKVTMPIQPIIMPQLLMQNITPTSIIGGKTSVPAISWLQIFFSLWLLGMLSTICYHAVRHYRFMRMVKRWSDDITDKQTMALLQALKSEMGISKHIGLQLCTCICSPMMIGFAKPRILLSRADFSKDELGFILKHELVHYKRKDLWYKCLVLSASAIHWFNPVVHFMARAIDVQSELSCDEEVIRSTDAFARQQYSETIIGVIRYQSKRKTALSTNFNGGKKSMKRRIFSIMDTSKKKAGIAIISCALLLTLGTGMAFAANNTKVAPNASTVRLSDETAARYSIYVKYGLISNKDNGRFYYEDKLVRTFDDKNGEGGMYFAAFSYADGVVDLKAIRNSNGELTGIETASKAEYDARTLRFENLEKEHEQYLKEHPDLATYSIASNAQTQGSNDLATETSPVNSYSTGDAQAQSSIGSNDPNYVDNTLNDYLNYGISYDKSSQTWMFGDKPITFLSDTGHGTFVNTDAEKNGVSLKVVRNAKEQIEKVVKLTDEEMLFFQTK